MTNSLNINRACMRLRISYSRNRREPKKKEPNNQAHTKHISIDALIYKSIFISCDAFLLSIFPHLFLHISCVMYCETFEFVYGQSSSGRSSSKKVVGFWLYCVKSNDSGKIWSIRLGNSKLICAFLAAPTENKINDPGMAKPTRNAGL